MPIADIAHENLCISRLIAVVKGRNTQQNKLLTIDQRHSDAFVYILSGSCTYRFSDKTTFQAAAGDVFYLPNKAKYTMYIHTPDYKFIFCDFVFAEPQEKRSLLFPGQALPNIGNLFQKLLSQYTAHRENSLTECMAILYSIYGTLQNSSQKVYLGKIREDYIAQAKQHLDNNFHDSNLSIAQLAQKCDISEVYFRKLFKLRYGISPVKYLTSIRINHAKTLMRYPFLSLEDCALQSGFSSQQYFSRLFKQETGLSPGKYKREKF